MRCPTCGEEMERGVIYACGGEQQRNRHLYWLKSPGPPSYWRFTDPFDIDLAERVKDPLQEPFTHALICEACDIILIDTSKKKRAAPPAP